MDRTRQNSTVLTVNKRATLGIVVAVLLAVATLTVSVVQIYGRTAWEWASYSDWKPRHDGGRVRVRLINGRIETTVVQEATFLKVKTQRASWLPGMDEIKIEISQDEWKKLQGQATY